MQPVSKQGIPITDFLGLKTSNGRIATADDAQTSSLQINLAVIATGEMKSRPGLRPVTFDEDEQ